MTNVNLITVAEFTGSAPDVDVSQFDNPTLSGMISTASQMVADYLQYTPVAEIVVSEEVQGRIASNGDLVIYTKKVPIQSVASISILNGATSVSLTLTNGSGVNKYNIDYTQRRIVIPYQEILLQGTPIFTNFYALRGRSFLTNITYTGGWPLTEVPATIKQAVILFMRDLLSKRYNQSGAQRLSQGGLSMEFSSGMNMGESQLVKEAKRLLNPYRRIG
jgi:hypothetical protein